MPIETSLGGIMLPASSAVRIAARTAGLALLSCLSLSAGAQNYPEKPIRLLAAAAGGSTDTASRILVNGLGPLLGQALVVDNRGGLGTIPGDVVSKAPPDGYTLLVHTASLWVANMLAEKKNYDPIKDFAPISLMTSSPSVLVVNSAVPINSVKDLIEAARSQPGKINLAHGPSGSASHLAIVFFEMLAKVSVQEVPYKGAVQALNDVAAGQVQAMFANAPGAVPLVKAGKLKVLAVTSAAPSQLAPGVPTVAASGLPGFEQAAIVGMWAPAGTPNAIVRKLYQDTSRFLNQPDTKKL